VVVAVGGGDTALEETLYLSKIVRRIYLVHRRDAFRGTKIYQDKIVAEPKVELILNSIVTEVLGETEVKGVKLKNLVDGTESLLEANGVFIWVGIIPQVDFLPQELTRDPAGFIITDTDMRTNLPGIFAAGDVRSKLCRQVTTAVGDGATAAYAAGIFLEQLHEQ
jgi:thioredoxin reductase (NADPH)